jgi:hypothetical protein
MRKKIIGIFVTTLLVATVMPFTVLAQNVDTENETNNTIGLNSPPNPPIVTCPEMVRRGRWFEQRITVIDPDGDDIYIDSIWKWNLTDQSSSFITPCNVPEKLDNWFGPYPSGKEIVIISKIWNPTGNMTIGWHAKDIHEAESDWTYVETFVTVSKLINNTPFLQLLQNFLENHPILYQLFQRVL